LGQSGLTAFAHGKASPFWSCNDSHQNNVRGGVSLEKESPKLLIQLWLPTSALKEMKKRFVRRILARRDWAELSNEVDYDAKALAAACNVSLRTLQREFRVHLQTSPQRWLDWFRALKGRELIEAGMRLKEAASLLGFKQVSHLCRKVSESRKGI
jgi:AraC-like DNA-binding protein